MCFLYVQTRHIQILHCYICQILLHYLLKELTVSVKYATSPPAGGEWRKCDGADITKDFPGMYKWLFRAEDYFGLVPGFTDSLNAQLSMSFSGE